MEDWTYKHRKDQPDSKIATMWFVFTWNEFINLKHGLEVYVNGKEYTVFGWGDFHVGTGCVRIDLKEI